MAWDTIARIHSFSLSDFHDFDHCVFRFFVNHHLQKKYELAEGSANQTIGTLLDLSIKKFHTTRSYNQPWEYVQNLMKLAEAEIRDDVSQKGTNSFYGPQIPFLTAENINKAKEIFKNYYEGLGRKVKRLVVTKTLSKIRPFWKKEIQGTNLMQIWGGPDAIEMGEDNLPEVVDYKYFNNQETGPENLDMDLMPKIYTLLCTTELMDLGYQKARFKIRFWQDPNNESYYEEFDLASMKNIEDFLRDKMERILRTDELSFCEQPFCRACQSAKREEWIKELQKQGWIKLLNSIS